jgi:hypothetical protein
LGSESFVNNKCFFLWATRGQKERGRQKCDKGQILQTFGHKRIRLGHKCKNLWLFLSINVSSGSSYSLETENIAGVF